MDYPGVTVLLVGGTAQNASLLQHHLLERGCKLSFASSKKAAIDLLESHSFHLILTEFMLPDGTAFQLIPALLGTNATMFFSTAVEDSCLWMSAVIRGKDCSVESAMRPREFTALLDRILSEMQFPDSTLALNENLSLPGQKTGQLAEKRLKPGRSRWSFSPWIQNKESFMRRREKSNPLPYFLIPARADNESNFRRWNQVLISILGILVLGIFLAALVPQQGGGSSSASTMRHVLLEKAHISTTDESSAILHDVQVENLTPAIANHLGISGTATGIVVASVDPSSPAEIASLESGDVIEQVNHSAVSDVADFDRALASSHDEPVSLLIKRGVDTKVVVVDEAH
jgi:CheY-like chemotaxis protein